MSNFKSVLYLDDLRTPTIFGIEVVRNYDQFVWHLENKEIPELISFDHDLSFEHYPLSEENPGVKIPYDSYKEKTGYHCAKWIVENKIPIKYWFVHSFNSVGKANIEEILRAYAPNGEVKGLQIPFRSKL